MAILRFRIRRRMRKKALVNIIITPTRGKSINVASAVVKLGFGNTNNHDNADCNCRRAHLVFAIGGLSDGVCSHGLGGLAVQD